MFRSTVKYAGEYIFIKPVCDFFGIQYDNQARRINGSPLLKTSTLKFTDKLLFGDERERLTLTKRGFITWVLQLNPQIVQVSLREKLYEYQTLIFDFLFGSIEREKETQVTYQRLAKLERLSSKIDKEIRLCKQQISEYLNGKFRQLSIDFSHPNNQL